MVSSVIAQDIEGTTAAPKISLKMVSFPPLHVYFHLGTNLVYITPLYILKRNLPNSRGILTSYFFF